MITTKAMNELCTLMKHRQLTAEIFGAWVSRHYAWIDLPPRESPDSEPRSVESARQRVTEFDVFLMHRGIEDSRFIRAIIGLRNMFALHAGLRTPMTIQLGAPTLEPLPPRRAPAPTWDLSELLTQLLTPRSAIPSF